MKNSHERNERGATAVEYGVFIAAIAAVIIIVVFALGLKTQNGLQSLLDLWS